jgi:hypothetical protein
VPFPVDFPEISDFFEAKLFIIIFRERHGEAPTNAPEPYKAGRVVRAAGKNPKIRILSKYSRFPPPVLFFGHTPVVFAVFSDTN